jgi:hypothetical protein
MVDRQPPGEAGDAGGGVLAIPLVELNHLMEVASLMWTNDAGGYNTILVNIMPVFVLPGVVF